MSISSFLQLFPCFFQRLISLPLEDPSIRLRETGPLLKMGFGEEDSPSGHEKYLKLQDLAKIYTFKV